MDMMSLIGIIVGISAVFGGNVLEGGKTSWLVQPTAAFIVLCGAIGATLLSHSPANLKKGLGLIKLVFGPIPFNRKQIAESLIQAAEIARKESILALEKMVASYPSEFMRTLLGFAIDGVPPQDIKSYAEIAIFLEEDEVKKAAKVWEDIGGYAPTVGIIGAVLGLIAVMRHLDNSDAIGSGIAVAFVATVYGLMLANLVALPMANKMKNKAKEIAEINEMILVGIAGITEGLSPKRLQSKLNIFLDEHDRFKEE